MFTEPVGAEQQLELTGAVFTSMLSQDLRRLRAGTVSCAGKMGATAVMVALLMAVWITISVGAAAVAGPVDTVEQRSWTITVQVLLGLTLLSTQESVDLAEMAA